MNDNLYIDDCRLSKWGANEVSTMAEDEKLAELCRALSYPARVQILRLLAGHDTYCGDLVKVLNLSQSTISHHLKALREAGFISGATEGPATCYRLNRERLHELSRLIDSIT